MAKFPPLQPLESFFLHSKCVFASCYGMKRQGLIACESLVPLPDLNEVVKKGQNLASTKNQVKGKEAKGGGGGRKGVRC